MRTLSFAVLSVFILSASTIYGFRLMQNGCPTGYYLDLVLGNCVSCAEAIPDCVECLNENYCTRCAEGTELSDGVCSSVGPVPIACIDPHCAECPTRSDFCVRCSRGYFLVNGVCSPCQPDCLRCNSTLVCTECSPGYYLAVNSTCVPCYETCRHCVGPEMDRCTRCYPTLRLYKGRRARTGMCICAGRGRVFDPGLKRCVRA